MGKSFGGIAGRTIRGKVIALACLSAVLVKCTQEDFDDDLDSPDQSAAATACANLTVASITASADDGNVPANVRDNNLNTRWSSNGIGSFIRLDLGAPQQICGVSIAWYRGNVRTSNFVVAVSSDGSAFTTAFTGKSSGTTLNPESYAFASLVTGRYIRVTVNGNSENAWASITELAASGSPVPAPTPPPSSSTLDSFGIQKIYPTLAGGREWYVNMSNPKSDSMFRNLPTMTQLSDGSWQVSASQVRMEAWSPDNQQWRNVEITEYAKVTSSTDPLLQMYSRGGHHSTNTPCFGSAYKSRLYMNGNAAWVKEVTHPAYCGNRATVTASPTSLMNKWVGHKAVIYNIVVNGVTYVRMESYVDLDVTDANGNLAIRNNWKRASVNEDRGGWITNDADFTATCGRARDAILTGPGGTATQNIAAWRSDGQTWQWKYLSAREIQPPQ